MVVIRRVVGDRERRARLAERERDVAAREAVVEERARIARELHDVIAHNVSMMVDPGRCRAADARRRQRLDPRGAGDGRADRAQRADRDAPAGRHAARAMPPTRSRRSPTRRRAHTRRRRCTRPACRWSSTSRASPRAARRDRAVRLPDRAGSADQRAQTRRRRPRRGAASATAPTRSSSRSPTTAPGPGRRARRRARPGRHARAGRALRWPLRRRPRARRRLRRSGSLPADPMTSVADRRRPGTRPRRTAQDPRDRAATSRSSAKPATAQTRSPQPRRLRPDVVLMDIRMPVLDGIEATRRIVRAQPATRVLILTTFGLDNYVYDALRAGASGFMLKDAPPEEIAAAVQIVANGDALLAPAITRAVIEEFARQPPPTATRTAARRRRTDTTRTRGARSARPRPVQPRDLPASSSSARQPPRPTSPRSCRSSASATASKPSSTPTRAASSPRPGLGRPGAPIVQGFSQLCRPVCRR